MHRLSLVPKIAFVYAAIGWQILLLLSIGWGRAEEEGPITRLFDTGTSLAEPLSDSALAKQAGWKLVPEDNLTHRFSGDAVLLNDKLAVVLFKSGQGAEVYSRTGKGLRSRAIIDHGGKTPSSVQGPQGFQIVENSSASVMVKAPFTNGGYATAAFRLTTGEALLDLRPDDGNRSLFLKTRSSYVVVPDYFGDDMVYDTKLFRDVGLPVENFCLHLLGGGEAMVMNVWGARDTQVTLVGAEVGGAGELCRSEISCTPGKSIWLAFMEGLALWQTAKWPLHVNEPPPPFPAKWRCSLVRSNGLADSWDLVKGPAREQEKAPLQWPMIIYPLDRSVATPLTVTCPTDVMRNTLGVGPCQYILAVECLAAAGDPTPASVMEWVEKLFEQKKDKKSREEIQERLEQMAEHVGHARSRIGFYRDFASRTRKLLAGKEEIGPYELCLGDLERFVATGLAPSASAENARELTKSVTALIGTENAWPACRNLGEQIRAIGAAQDGTLARCRMAVRRLKQESLSQISRGKNMDVAQAIKKVTDEMLGPASKKE